MITASLDLAIRKHGDFSRPRTPVHSFSLQSARGSSHCLAVKSLAAKFLALVACLHMMGGHWIALKTVAWVGMFVENQRNTSLVEALEKTFDGQHPCALCCAIEKGQQDEGEKRPVELVYKWNAVLAPPGELPPMASSPLIYPEHTESPRLILLPLPSPPPWWV